MVLDVLSHGGRSRERLAISEQIAGLGRMESSFLKVDLGKESGLGEVWDWLSASWWNGYFHQGLGEINHLTRFTLNESRYGEHT